MNFNFGATPSTTGGFALPTPTQPSATTLPTFGVAPNTSIGTQQKAPAFGSAFGTSTPSTTGFTLGGAPNLSFGTPSTVINTTPTLNFGTSTATTGFALSTPGTASTVSTGSALTGFSLGTFSQPQTSTLSSTTPSIGQPNQTTASTGFSLGGTVSTAATGMASTGISLSTTTSTPGFSLGKVGGTVSSTTSVPTLTMPASSSVTSITAIASISNPTNVTGGLTFAQLEEALNKWNIELEDQGKMFLNQATQLNAWDRLVIANGDKILNLNKGIEKVKQQQQQLDHELDFILAQQRELEDCIAPLEKELNSVPIADLDRNQTYQMAENLDTQLKQMSEDLKEIIEHLNESNKTEDSADPVTHIGRILNAHMNSLQWIDRNTAQINSYLDQVNKMHDIHRRDNERSFHLTYE